MTIPDFDGPVGLTPLDRPGPLRSQVKDALIELIISRQLAPGEHMVEADIAGSGREALEVLAREPVAELRLEPEGLAPIYHRYHGADA